MKKSGKKKINLILIISSILLVCTSVGYANVTEDEIEKIKNKVKTELKSEIKKYLEDIEIGKFKRTEKSGTTTGIKISIKDNGDKEGEAKFSVGYLNFDGKNQIISGTVDAEKFVRGAFVRTKLDLYNHNFSLGALQFDGLHGNIYIANSPTESNKYLPMFQNNVGKGEDDWKRPELNSNIALGWGNSAGMKLKPIKKKISVGVKSDGEKDDKELIIGYEQERGNPGIKEKNKPFAKNYDLYHNYYSFEKSSSSSKTNKPSNNSTAIGVRNASYGKGAFAIGIESVAGNDGTFAGGENAISSGINSISYGNNTLSAGKESMSFGYYTKAYGNRSFASGYESEAYGNNAIAMGSWSYAKAENSLAFSGGTVESSATDGVAIGKGAVTKTKEGFSIGSEALADREKGKYGYNVIEGREYTNKDLGLDENEKYIDNISEIKNKKEKIKENISKIKNLEKENEKIKNNIKGLDEFNGNNVYEKNGELKWNILQKIKNEKNSLEEKLNKNKTNIQKLKTEREALDKELKGLEDKFKGVTPYFSTASAISIGNPDKGITRQLTGLAAGSEDTDAVNVAQLKAIKKYVDNKYITIKDGKGGETKVKLGDTITLKGTTVNVTVNKTPDTTSNKPASTSTSQSAQQAPAPEPKPQEHTVTYETDTFEYKLRNGDNATKLIEGADGKLYTKDFLDKNEYKDKKWINKETNKEIEESVLEGNQYEKGNDKVILSTKYGNIISNVSDGKEDKDAVNVSQLNAVSKKVDQNTTDIKNLKERVTEVEKKSDLALSGVANAVAMANLPQVMGDKKFNLAASYGYYGGSHAVAIGFSGTNDKQNFIYKLSGSVNNKGNLAFGIGAGVMLGEVNNKDKRISELETRLKEQTEKTNRLEKQLEKVMKKLGQN